MTSTGAKMRQRGFYGYVQDDVRVSSKLTVNVGLRYEYVTPYYEGENRLENPRIAEVRVSLPSDRSFASYEEALTHVTGSRLPDGMDLYWSQQLLSG